MSTKKELQEQLKNAQEANRALLLDVDRKRFLLDAYVQENARIKAEYRPYRPWYRRLWLTLTTPLLVLLFPLPAHADLASSWGVMVRTGTDVVAYSDNQNDEVPIALPTNRYVCTRRPIMTTPQMMVVMVSCTEGGRQAFVIGTGCSRSEPDSNQSVVTVNVSKNATPLTVTFTVACRTLDDTKTFL